jgi:hypothetical protein
METREKLNDSERAMVLTVLEELAQEQVNNTKAIIDLITTLNTQAGTIRELKEKIDNPKPVIVTADTRSMREVVNKGITDIKLIVGSKPQPIIRKIQLLLFPEQDAKLFYKIVFGRWFLYLVLMLSITCLYKFSVHWSDNQEQIQQKELETDRIKKLGFTFTTGKTRQGNGLWIAPTVKVDRQAIKAWLWTKKIFCPRDYDYIFLNTYIYFK